MFFCIAEKHYKMKEALKYLGIVIVIAGVLVLAIPGLKHEVTNTSLTVGGILLVVGLLAHIIINKIVK